MLWVRGPRSSEMSPPTSPASGLGRGAEVELDSAAFVPWFCHLPARKSSTSPSFSFSVCIMGTDNGASLIRKVVVRQKELMPWQHNSKNSVEDNREASFLLSYLFTPNASSSGTYKVGGEWQLSQNPRGI